MISPIHTATASLPTSPVEAVDQSSSPIESVRSTRKQGSIRVLFAQPPTPLLLSVTAWAAGIDPAIASPSSASTLHQHPRLPTSDSRTGTRHKKSASTASSSHTHRTRLKSAFFLTFRSDAFYTHVRPRRSHGIAKPSSHQKRPHMKRRTQSADGFMATADVQAQASHCSPLHSRLLLTSALLSGPARQCTPGLCAAKL